MNLRVLFYSLFLSLAFSSVHKIPVHHLLQYSKDNIEYGSRVVNLNNLLSRTTMCESRKVALLQNITIESLQECFDIQPTGVIIVLPLSHEITQYLLNQNFYIPIYFMDQKNYDTYFVNEKTRINPNENYQAVISASENSIFSIPPQNNLLCHLQPSGVSSLSNFPTILIVSHYDDYHPSPSLAVMNSLGVSLSIALISLFSSLFSHFHSEPQFQLSFLFGGSSHFDFEGIHNFLSETGNSYLDNIQFVLCLDKLDHGPFYLHSIRPNQTIYDLFLKESQNNRVNISTVMNPKTNKETFYDQNTTFSFPHEIFENSHIFSMTLSSYLQSIETTQESYNSTDSFYLLHLIYSVLLKHIFNLTDLLIPESTISQSSLSLMQIYLDYLHQHPRDSIFMDPLIIKQLEVVFKKYCHDYSRSTYTLSLSSYKFYGSVPSSTQIAYQYILNLSSVHPIINDIIYSLSIMLFLGILYLSFQVSSFSFYKKYFGKSKKN